MQDVIIEIIKEICLIETDDSILEKMFRTDLMLSSLDYIKIVTLIEDELNIELPDEILVVEEDFSVSNFIERIKEVMEDCK
jgi:acyl carrier protein